MPDVHLLAQALTRPASFSGLWHAPSPLLVSGPPPGSAAASLPIAVDEFYALSWVNAALRGISIMDDDPSRVCSCTADAFYLREPFGGLCRKGLCVSHSSHPRAGASLSGTMQRDIIAQYYALHRCDRLYFLLRLLPHPDSLEVLYAYVELHGGEQDLPPVFHNHYRYWLHHRALLPSF